MRRNDRKQNRRQQQQRKTQKKSYIFIYLNLFRKTYPLVTGRCTEGANSIVETRTGLGSRPTALERSTSHPCEQEVERPSNQILVIGSLAPHHQQIKEDIADLVQQLHDKAPNILINIRLQQSGGGKKIKSHLQTVYPFNRIRSITGFLNDHSDVRFQHWQQFVQPQWWCYNTLKDMFKTQNTGAQQHQRPQQR